MICIQNVTKKDRARHEKPLSKILQEASTNGRFSYSGFVFLKKKTSFGHNSIIKNKSWEDRIKTREGYTIETSFFKPYYYPNKYLFLSENTLLYKALQPFVDVVNGISEALLEFSKLFR
jgi:hypothetical protein